MSLQAVVETVAFVFVLVTIPLYLLQLFVIWTCFGKSKKHRGVNQPFFKLVFVVGIWDIGKQNLENCSPDGIVKVSRCPLMSAQCFLDGAGSAGSTAFTGRL